MKTESSKRGDSQTKQTDGDGDKALDRETDRQTRRQMERERDKAQAD